ncbi:MULTISPECIES: molybdopterin-containing oxidoreductase family protein [Sphingobium]|uniref:molybdopterin-containing oxidoreductase family protein n=1 Tax=Sphingobium TaxID=165695 RepID=UPI00159C6F30|nr:molybdopterin-dependent oxidoreductase [Sphingobium sp. 15-1]
MATHQTYCRNCAAACGLLVAEEAGVIQDIRGDKAHPVSQGYFCIKGMATRDLHNGEDRLHGSLRRNDEGTFDPIDTEVALDEIGHKLSGIIAEYGAEAVAVYCGTGASCNVLTLPAAKGWLSALGSPYFFSSMTVDQSAKWVTAGRMGMFPTGKHKLPHADVLMIVGSNPAASHACYGMPSANPIKQVRDAQRNGTTFIVVDPRATELARAADLHLAVRPGQDSALFAGLIRIILSEGLENKAFCARFTTSVDRLRAAVEPFTPDHVAGRTGISVEALHRAARLFAQAKRQSVLTGTGSAMALNSNLSEHLIEAMNALCGGYRTAGEPLGNTGYYGNMATRETVVPPRRSWESGPKLRSVDIGPLGGEYPTSRLPAEIAGGPDGRIRALIHVGGNLVKALPEPDRTIPMLRDLDLFVSLDVRENATGRLADYQIATTAPYEHHDFNLALEYMLTTTFAQVAEPFMQRPAGVIDDWEFFRGLAQRMGMTLPMRRPIYGMAHRDIPGPELTITGDMTGEDLMRWLAEGGRSNYDTLRAHPGGIHFTDAVATVEPAGDDDGARLDLCPVDVEAEIAAMLGDRDDVTGYPYRVITRRLIDTLNSAYTQASKTRRRFPTNPIYMNEADMAGLDVAEGGLVRLTARNGGVVIGRVRKDRGLQPGVISMSHGWGEPLVSGEQDSDSFSGRLVSLDQDLEPINFMPRQSSVPVQARRHDG